ncbi:hypothetical protein B0T11DRAFT_272502 [Plectosphaerella cucumerina]|uniref:Uncharacterized protein n=1 Tax=Plectosphaerella cucumerina TaxID=40658 RepID=A0A8K0TUR0_9PEZI|nr:hypothetical protein B0T11DRAFT_272502 [Plectosphaerella cucumerina]
MLTTAAASQECRDTSPSGDGAPSPDSMALLRTHPFGCGLGSEERCMISLAVCRPPRSRHRRSTFSPTLRSSLDWVSTGSDAGTLQLVNRCRMGEPSNVSGTSRRTVCRLVSLAGGTILDPDSGLGFCGLQTQRSTGLTVSPSSRLAGVLTDYPFRTCIISGPTVLGRGHLLQYGRRPSGVPADDQAHGSSPVVSLHCQTATLCRGCAKAILLRRRKASRSLSRELHLTVGRIPIRVPSHRLAAPLGVDPGSARAVDESVTA